LELPNRITKYEIAALIGYRAQQLAEGADPYIVFGDDFNPIAIAIEEYKQGKIPLMIERPFPSNKIARYRYETFKLDELINVMPL
jgi:DNA-directed RNA polymerase subunit K